MKWFGENKKNPVVGESRIRKKFLWFPFTDSITNETRWLEFANIKEEFCRIVSMEGMYAIEVESFKRVKKCFIEKEIKKNE